jgi:DNA-nicking Smr family endonuclease
MSRVAFRKNAICLMKSQSLSPNSATIFTKFSAWKDNPLEQFIEGDSVDCFNMFSILRDSGNQPSCALHDYTEENPEDSYDVPIKITLKPLTGSAIEVKVRDAAPVASRASPNLPFTRRPLALPQVYKQDNVMLPSVQAKNPLYRVQNEDRSPDEDWTEVLRTKSMKGSVGRKDCECFLSAEVLRKRAKAAKDKAEYERLSNLAADAAFRKSNQDWPQSYKLDLHYLSVLEAMEKLAAHLPATAAVVRYRKKFDRFRRRWVEVVTGAGNHSVGRPKLEEAVRVWLGELGITVRSKVQDRRVVQGVLEVDAYTVPAVLIVQPGPVCGSVSVRV